MPMPPKQHPAGRVSAAKTGTKTATKAATKTGTKDTSNDDATPTEHESAPPVHEEWDIDAVTQDTPDYLVPKMDHDAVSTPMFYNQLVMRDPDAAKVAKNEVTKAFDPFGELPEETLPNTAIEGALLTYEQGWFEKGLALGRLLHSTCLAPGEVTKIAITSFHRASRGTSQEAATQSDSVDSASAQASAVHETQQAVSHDTQSGHSLQFGAASQSQAAVSGGGLFVSGSASTSLSMSMGVGFASSASASDIAAKGSKNLSQRTVAASHAVRGRRAAQVREASEEEAQSAATRVIANYNHMHALTMMFFEVLQIYQLKTKVVHAERVVFLPMENFDFSEDNVRQHGERLRDILVRFGMTAEVAAMDEFLSDNFASLKRAELDAAAKLDGDLVFVGSSGLRDYPDYPEAESAPRLFVKEIAFWEAELLKPSDKRDARTEEALPIARERLKRMNGSLPAYRRARAKLMRASRIVDILRENATFFSQQMWLALRPGEVQRLVKGKTFKGEGLVQLMDPRPLGVHGHYMAFRLPHSDPKGDSAYAKGYAMDGDGAPSAQVVLPSGGVFGEAVLGQAVSAEKIDLTRFWNWKDSPIPILPPDMDPVSLATRARGTEFSKVELEKSITELLKPALMDGADLSGIVSKITANVRDMSGQEGLSSRAIAQISAAKEGAAKAGDLSVETLKANQAFGKALLDSDIVKAGFAAMMPEGEAATVLGGLIGATKGGDKGGAAKKVASAATKAASKTTTKPAPKPKPKPKPKNTP